MPQFRLFCYSMPLSASGKGSGLRSLKADLLNGLVENTKIENPDIVKLVGNSGCSLVAVLNTANIYGPREFTPNEVLTACGNWGANGLNTWALPSKCNGKIDTSNYTHGGKEQATVFSAVKASIDNNLPIIIRLNSSDGKKTHFVTAIAYTGSCSSASSISVIDPAGGVIRTLEEAGTARNETVYGDYIATARRS